MHGKGHGDPVRPGMAPTAALPAVAILNSSATVNSVSVTWEAVEYPITGYEVCKVMLKII